MSLAFVVSEKTGADIFTIFNQSANDVIDVINYLIERAEDQTEQATHIKASEKQESGDTFRIGGARKHDEFWDYV